MFVAKLLFILYCTGFQQSAAYQVDGNADTANLVPFQGMLEYFIGSPIADIL